MAKIIGINPGTRYTGIAVFHGLELRDWQVRNIDGRWSDDKMTNIILSLSSLIDCHKPDALAIKKLHPSRSSPNLKELVDRVNKLAKRKGLKVCQYTIDELKAHFQSGSRRELAEKVTEEYPILSHELRVYLTRDRAWKERYQQNMFDAVALGLIALSTFKVKHNFRGI